jgi:hypothetical protein
MNFLAWLTILFIYLKLTNQIDWSWFFVVLPFFLQLPLEEFVKWAHRREKKHS